MSAVRWNFIISSVSDLLSRAAFPRTIGPVLVTMDSWDLDSVIFYDGAVIRVRISKKIKIKILKWTACGCYFNIELANLL
jgi:hypothetical protein